VIEKVRSCTWGEPAWCCDVCLITHQEDVFPAELLKFLPAAQQVVWFLHPSFLIKKNEKKKYLMTVLKAEVPSVSRPFQDRDEASWQGTAWVRSACHATLPLSLCYKQRPLASREHLAAAAVTSVLTWAISSLTK